MYQRIEEGYERSSAANIGPRIEALVSEGQQVTLQISGDSIRPTFKPRRDALVLAPVDTWPPRSRDILFYRTAR